MAIESFNAWIVRGKSTDVREHPVFSKDNSLLIFKTLLPRIAPTENIGEYKTMKKYNEWIDNLAGGTT